MDGEVLEFGNVRFKPKNGRLEVAGALVELDRSSLAILAVLIEQAGHTVSKEHLLEVGWPDRFVQENSLTKAISRLRSALLDDGKSLKTVHGYGYCLDVSVARSVEKAGASHVVKSDLGKRPLAIVAVVAVLLVSLTSFVLSGREDGVEPVTQSEAPDVIGRVLWVDDNPTNNATERRLLAGNGIAVHQVESTEEAMRQLTTYSYDVVISDMGRSGNRSAGIDLLSEMRAENVETPFILYTFEVTPELLELVGSEGGQAVTARRADLYGEIFPIFGLVPPTD